MNNRGTAYLLWLGCFLGPAGLHRFYNGKYLSGLLWLCTWGLFGIGQFVDLFLIPDMVEMHNTKRQLRQALSPQGSFTPQVAVEQVVKGHPNSQQAIATPTPVKTIAPKEELMLKLLYTAQKQGGKLSVTQGVMATGAGFTEIETILKDMAKTGYVGITNDPATGIVLYDFKEL